MSRASEWTAPAAGVRWTTADGRAAVRAWKRSGLTLAEFERRHDLGTGRLRWWKRRVESEGTRDAINLVPMVATKSPAAAVVVVRIAEVEIEVRADLVSAQWLAQLVSELMATRQSA
jgi:transposase-like protein